uniref:C2H2-type domain-containing protein n=1 Tax=Fundulus heteroclitus TaxID=8078 RepID=A0A3Q2QQH0_FUNHE
MLVIKEEFPHDWSSSLHHQHPELPHIKEEEEELTVKCEDEDKLQLIELHHIKTEGDRETVDPTSSLADPDGQCCAGPEADENPHQICASQQNKQQLLVVKEEVPDLWSYSFDQQNPELLQIKKEEEELGILQEGEQSAVKIEHEENQQLSELHQIKTEDNSETEAPTCSSAIPVKTKHGQKVCGGPEPNWDQDTNTEIQPNTDRNSSDSSETEVSTEDGDDNDDNLSSFGSETEETEETKTLQSGVNSSVGDKTLQKLFRCPECYKQFTYRQSFMKHLKCHSGENTYQKPSESKAEKNIFICKKCGETFKDIFHLRSHVNIHTKEKPFACDDCGKEFRQAHVLKLHMRVHTGEKPFACDECGKTFSHKHSLKGHMTHHTGEKPFKCEECGKTFGVYGILRNHMTIHKGEKPFACNSCDKSFRLRGDLHAHMLTHLGIKPFGCSYCGASFTRQGTLTRHVRRHTGEKPFFCDKCDKMFYRNSELRYHMSTHLRERKVATGKRKFACKECGEKYIRKVHLTAHMSTHSGEKPFSCSVCSARFTRKDSLKRHSVRVHSQ